jgi:large subunit ribosomal protein L19
MRNAIITKVESASYKKASEIPSFNVGDTVKVMQRVVEGSKTRSQAFEGIVIAKAGAGIQSKFTVRRISFGEGVEKSYKVHSPTVQSITVTRQGKVRRAKLYYLRTKSGKEGRIDSATAAALKESTTAAV